MKRARTLTARQKIDCVRLHAAVVTLTFRHAQRRARRIVVRPRREALFRMLAHVSAGLAAFEAFSQHPNEEAAVKAAELLHYGPELISLEIFDSYHRLSPQERLSPSWLKQLGVLCSGLRVLAEAIAEISPYAYPIVHAPNPLEA